MHQTVYPERRTRERHLGTDTAHSVDAFQPREASGGRHAARRVVPPGGPIDDAYERFLRLPLATVLGTLWLLGLALVSSVVLVLYVLSALVATVVG